MYRRNCFPTLVGILILFTSMLNAQEAGRTVITQEQAVKVALEKNPDVVASLNQLEEAKTSILTAREFANTSIDFDFDQQVDLFSPDEIYFGFSQEFEFPTRNGIREDLAKAGVSTATLEHVMVQRQSIVAIKEIYQKLAYAQSSVELGKENLEMAASMESIAREKFEVGSVGKLDLLRAQVEKANAEDDLQALIREQKVLQIKLNYLLGNSLDTNIATTSLKQAGKADLQSNSLTTTALKNRVELKILQAKKSEKKLEANLVRSLYYPDFSVGFNRHSVYQEADSWDTTFSVSVPIFGRGNIAGQMAQVKAAEKSLDTLLGITTTAVKAEVISAMAELEHISKRLERIEGLIIKTAKEALDIAQASYEEGEIGNLELIEMKRTYQEARINLLETILAYNETYINLESAIGTDLSW
jgi:outer membrane protein TolC